MVLASVLAATCAAARPTERPHVIPLALQPTHAKATVLAAPRNATLASAKAANHQAKAKAVTLPAAISNSTSAPEGYEQLLPLADSVATPPPAHPSILLHDVPPPPPRSPLPPSSPSPPAGPPPSPPPPMPKDDGLAFSRPYDGQQAFNQLPPNPPNPPPSPSPSPPEVIGYDIGMPVAMTGDPWIDGRRRSAVASHRLMHHVMLPIGVTAVVVVLFLLDCAVHISATISARPNLQSNLRLALCTTSFITCSVAMTVFNKVALVAVPLPLVLVTLQMGVTVVLVLLWNAFAVCVGGRAWWQIKAGSKRDVLRWAPVSLLFAASLYTFTAALHYSTLGAVITWRNLAPLPTMLVECCCFSHARLGLGLGLGLGQGLGSGSGLGLGLGSGPKPKPKPDPY